MSRRFQDPLPFSPQYDFDAFKPFVYNGVRYECGDAFPHEDTEAEDLPSVSLLEKLYRQKKIVVRAERPQEDLKPGPVQDSMNAAAADAAAEMQAAAAAAAASADGGESSQAGDGETPPASDTDKTDEATENQGDTDGERQPAGAEGGGGPEVTEPTAPEGKLKRVNKGFGKNDVVAENGFVVASGLTKAEADAKVAEGNKAA